jgi:hypothetical protein
MSTLEARRRPAVKPWPNPRFLVLPAETLATIVAAMPWGAAGGEQTAIGIDPPTGDVESPTIWLDTDAKELVIQGWKANDALRL